MKKQLSLLGIAAALVVAVPAYSATNSGTRAGSSVDLTSGPATRTRQSVNYAKYQTRSSASTYERQDGKNIYYTKPADRSAMYKQYASGNTQTVRTSRSETVRTEMKRKYYLAHPFYQPLKGKFGSITDLSYTRSSYDFKLGDVDSHFAALDGSSASWKTNQFAIKEDFSYGITDRIALVGMLRYEINEYKFHWNIDNSDDVKKDHGFNMFGIGAQFRVVDTSDWIAELSAYFEYQKDVANDYLIELKAGYKVSRSTIYALARGWYLGIKGDAYGNGLELDNPTRSMFMAYKIDNKAFYVEGGLGVFSVLAEDWTLNVEGIYGHYDWHDQLSIKGEIGWQPNDWFGLSLYARASLYDSANNKQLGFYWYEPGAATLAGTDFAKGLAKAANATLSNNQEMSFGLRAMFQF